MRTHIFIALIALVVSACASKENLSASQQARLDEREELQSKVEYLHVDGRAGI